MPAVISVLSVMFFKLISFSNAWILVMLDVKNDFYICDCKCNSTLFISREKKKISLSAFARIFHSGSLVVGRKIKFRII